MGVAVELGVAGWRRPRVARAVDRLVASRPGAWVMARVMPRVDGLVRRHAGGRSAVESMGAVPTVFVTTRGARSGLPRTVALLGIPVGDDLALVGSNWGGRAHPAWVHNLAAHPEVTVSRNDRSVAAVARRVEGAERAEVWRAADAVYGGFRSYRRRAGDRDIQVFVLSRRT